MQGVKEDLPKQSKWRSFVIRARTTFILIGSFCFFIWMGHVPLMAMILGIQVAASSSPWSCMPGRQEVIVSVLSSSFCCAFMSTMIVFVCYNAHTFTIKLSCYGLQSESRGVKQFRQIRYLSINNNRDCCAQYLMVKELYKLAETAHKRQNLSDKRKPPKWLFFCVATFWQYFR